MFRIVTCVWPTRLWYNIKFDIIFRGCEAFYLVLNTFFLAEIL